ncbi:hypothetical protein I5Q96_11185 [Serratia marcescens]|nr:hypothetical protein [Serratia marcescens]MBH3041565.1 hypothetical protein [Serratia marcescens]
MSTEKRINSELAAECEALKAERDALERQLSMSEAKCKGYFSDAAAALVRCDSLAVENAVLKSKAAELVHEASEVYSAYNSTVREPDGDFMDMQTLYEMQRIETPATDAALAAIEARGVEKFAEFLDSPIDGQHCYQNEVGLARHFASTLREAK